MNPFRNFCLNSSKPRHSQSRARLSNLESLESRDLLAADLVISEVHFDPTFGDSDQDQYLEVRGTPGATIDAGTYFVVVEGDAGSSDNPGIINSVIDLGGLTLGSNGYLVVMQGGASYQVDPNSASIQGNTGFAGLPGDRFADNAGLSDRFDFLFDSNSFLLVESSVAPQPDFDIDQNDDGQIDSIGWTKLDSVSLIGTHVGGTENDIAYGDIVFRADGNTSQHPGRTVVDVHTVTYVARVSAAGHESDDWMAAETREATDDQFDFYAFARSGNEAYRKFIGRELDHVGSANFFSTLEGTQFHDENGNGVQNAGEFGDSQATVYLDYNSDGELGSFETVAEPDNFNEGTALTNVFRGVTLTTADDNNQILTFPIEAESAGEASTGSLAFSQGSRRLMMDFTHPVSSVSIDFSADFASRRGIMEAYDVDGNLVDAYLTQEITNAAETMTVFSNEGVIAYAVAYPDDNVSPFGTLDNLRFTQPELSTTTDANGQFEIGLVAGNPGASMDVRTLADIHEAVTSPVSGKHSVAVDSPEHFTSLDFGVDSRQPHDIVGRTTTGAWWAALSDGTSFTNDYQTNWSTAVQWSDVLEGQFRGGHSEVVGRNGDELWVSENDGTTVIPKFWGDLPFSTDWVDVMVGDLNGDNRSDWVGRHDGEWWVGESQSNDSFLVKKWSTWSTSVTWEDVQLGDFNGDGKDDIAGRANGQWWVAVSTGSPFDSIFQNQNWAQWSNQVQWQDVMTGDFNGDGLDDIAGRANGDWWISRSNGSAFVTEYWGRWSPSAQWSDVLVADFNGDGMDDIAGRTNGGWWISQSVDNFFLTSPWGNWSTSVAWVDVVAADFTGDGRDDIAGRANGDWWVGVSNGQQFTSQKWARWSTGVDWVDVQVGHFGDGGSVSGSSVSVEIAGEPGDVNRNGKVGFEDFLILSGNFGLDAEPGASGDVDGDGRVAFADFLILSGNFGKSGVA